MTLPTVTLLASLDPLLRERAIAAARSHDPFLVVVRHELTTLPIDDTVHRRVEGPDRHEDVALPVEGGCCLSCLLREDTLSILADLEDRHVLLVLPPAFEPASAAIALHEHDAAHLAAIATAVDLSTLEGRLWDEAALADLEDLGDDPRSQAEVLARQLGTATWCCTATVPPVRGPWPVRCPACSLSDWSTTRRGSPWGGTTARPSSPASRRAHRPAAAGLAPTGSSSGAGTVGGRCTPDASSR